MIKYLRFIHGVEGVRNYLFYFLCHDTSLFLPGMLINDVRLKFMKSGFKRLKIIHMLNKTAKFILRLLIFVSMMMHLSFIRFAVGKFIVCLIYFLN